MAIDGLHSAAHMRPVTLAGVAKVLTKFPPVTSPDGTVRELPSVGSWPKAYSRRLTRPSLSKSKLFAALPLLAVVPKYVCRHASMVTGPVPS